ncbi:hypothetical protein CDD81_4001 [Ophiocordyceps australis]|uniref:Uncharacterized protein n=1 Tax=Ophiocordyceps australis TaxID=1399860 RepID=A0A2C5XAJ4_9HYPO|nr:hypothetical protein CDD81_4001 [Ophiocordyceps australis]
MKHTFILALLAGFGLTSPVEVSSKEKDLTAEPVPRKMIEISCPDVLEYPSALKKAEDIVRGDVGLPLVCSRTYWPICTPQYLSNDSVKKLQQIEGIQLREIDLLELLKEDLEEANKKQP